MSSDSSCEFKVERWMTPEAKVMIYFIHKTGEVIYDTVTLEGFNELPNKVRAKF
jgi:Alpha-2-macroglobulin bait region domain